MLFDLPLLTPHFVIRGFSMTRFEYTPRSHNATSENTQFDERPEFIFSAAAQRGGRIATNGLTARSIRTGGRPHRATAERHTSCLALPLLFCKYARQHRIGFQINASCCGPAHGGVNKLVS